MFKKKIFGFKIFANIIMVYFEKNIFGRCTTEKKNISGEKHSGSG